MKNALVICTFLCAAAFLACNKEKDLVRLNVRLTDGPGAFQQVNVDIREVRVKMSGDSAQWLILMTNAGVYNLLDFQNGLDTLLATGTLPGEVLKEVRFLLGENNSVMVDGVVFPLDTPSVQDSGLKIKVDKHLNLDVNTLVLDFDAQQSILLTGAGQYKLKPVIKVKV
ncbi:MAG: DUF4382 domain-containing protein [Saprospiraceae bacterium]|nr:DUF4382 domain-containing protein [Saprospiraceae bacterium]